MHMLVAAVVITAIALDSVVVSTIDVIAAVDTVAAKVEESGSIVVTPISSELLSTLEGRQGLLKQHQERWTRPTRKIASWQIKWLEAVRKN